MICPNCKKATLELISQIDVKTIEGKPKIMPVAYECPNCNYTEFKEYITK